jgi:pimeloyl-ACP methyl ester carboxylesterase
MKVLLVHGITTPCISLGAIAHGLAERGCRVMLLDLWGRGYSDSCSDLPHDDRLYATEILVALTSSSLSWTGGADGGFCLIGYSLGGGISAAFTSYFPNLVKSLVLLAPAGIIRPEHTSGRSRLLYSAGLVPERLLYWLIKKRLKAGPMKRAENKATPINLVGAEVEGDAP